MPDPRTKEQLVRLLDAKDRMMGREHKKSAAANLENEALRQEIRRLRSRITRHEKYLENTRSQVGYKVRYERLLENMSAIRSLSSVELTGLPDKIPTTIEPWPSIDTSN